MIDVRNRIPAVQLPAVTLPPAVAARIENITPPTRNQWIVAGAVLGGFTLGYLIGRTVEKNRAINGVDCCADGACADGCCTCCAC